MVNKPKNKGTAGETMVKDHLIGSGLTSAHRSALSGAADIGDIIGVPGFAVQVKNQATLHIPEWLRATETQRCNGGEEYGVLIVKRNGIGARNVGLWSAVMVDSQWLKLYTQAGRPSLGFLGRGKSPQKALAWSMLPTEVWTLQFRDKVEVFTSDGFEKQCRVMSLDGWISMHKKAFGGGNE